MHRRVMARETNELRFRTMHMLRRLAEDRLHELDVVHLVLALLDHLDCNGTDEVSCGFGLDPDGGHWGRQAPSLDVRPAAGEFSTRLGQRADEVCPLFVTSELCALAVLERAVGLVLARVGRLVQPAALFPKVAVLGLVVLVLNAPIGPAQSSPRNASPRLPPRSSPSRAARGGPQTRPSPGRMRL